MSKASTRTPAGHAPRIEGVQRATAVLVSVLLHLWLAWLLLSTTPMTPNDPQGAEAGSPMVVDFVGLTPPQPVQAPHASPPPPRPRAPTRAAPSRVRTTEVIRADEARPQESDAQTPAITELLPQPPVPHPPPPSPAPVAGAATSPPTAQRARTWGQPPGMLPQATSPVNAGTGRNVTAGRGRGRDSSSGPSMEAGGYQVIYDLRSETRLRAWRDAGMTEVFFPLPGTRQRMVCPLETALRRESGPCRLLEPDDPELASIGDAREVITMHGVYRRGEMLWRGPGAYR
ncbi:type II toxin-antitoxin system RelE/ParE family toxin [Luteimonas yindakuii]|uniref:Type II toxin-antitoxin system RelE/ParE family toxin n=1 Tax=Luteimonas yindakuii TaxID=2565782 RepID=A0A4Z1RAM0_9GAMM|nr:type II toxin-antitoxin system RelE/ParE family toxin [Luteimonas yindakuii]TKS53233.1 type II toxin-antitoxin system RelE/ParE family toxin [Luteimonas yindakuii]